MSCYSGVTPNSVLQRRHGSQMKFKEPIRSRMSIRGASHGKKAKKWALAASHDSSKPMKMPKLGIREASNFSMPKRMTCVNFEGWYSRRWDTTNLSDSLPEPAWNEGGQ
ncbi:uncharacterized protein Fot_14439 [Forsythia ovata]|uniref:Uncharacterized protein n=1 Tax=Forsythia ovata TaxID=205694 RepID=A0ABD1W6B3_9LAMI